jgi:hypothetical protein
MEKEDFTNEDILNLMKENSDKMEELQKLIQEKKDMITPDIAKTLSEQLSKIKENLKK